MENLITLDYLSTFGGMVTVVVLLTEFTKELIDKVTKGCHTKYIVFIYSLITIISYQTMTDTFDPSKLLITIINAILLTMTAQGGYEWTFKSMGQKSKKYK